MASLIGQESVWAQCQILLKKQCHIFITGPPGSGKTNLMKELLQEYAHKTNKKNAHLWGEESNEECMFLSPEQDRGIQTIRGQVSLFIRQMAPFSTNGEMNWRWVIIDDVDTFPQISQQALRRPMETHSHITRFIFIGNSMEDLIPAIQSRCIHISMNLVFPMFYPNKFLDRAGFTEQQIKEFSNDMWSWIMNVSQNNVADTLRLLQLVYSIIKTLKHPLTLKTVQSLCSVPFHVDFVPLLNAIQDDSYNNAAKALIHIWKRGYTCEDIIESFQSIHELYGDGELSHNIKIHIFLVNAWIAYCKGNTSILSLQNVLYKTFTQKEVELIDDDIRKVFPSSQIKL
jgi:replication-associated recombination protein RarA